MPGTELRRSRSGVLCGRAGRRCHDVVRWTLTSLPDAARQWAGHPHGVDRGGQRLDQRRLGITQAVRDDVEAARWCDESIRHRTRAWQPTTLSRSQMLYRPARQ